MGHTGEQDVKFAGVRPTSTEDRKCSDASLYNFHTVAARSSQSTPIWIDGVGTRRVARNWAQKYAAARVNTALALGAAESYRGADFEASDVIIFNQELTDTQIKSISNARRLCRRYFIVSSHISVYIRWFCFTYVFFPCIYRTILEMLRKLTGLCAILYGICMEELTGLCEILYGICMEELTGLCAILYGICMEELTGLCEIHWGAGTRRCPCERTPPGLLLG